MRKNTSSGRPGPVGDDAAILALAATTLRRLADLLTATAAARSTGDQSYGDDLDRAAAVDDARQALESVHATIQDLIARATAATRGSTHPKLEQALTALRQAATEAAEAAQLLAPPGTGGGAAVQDGAGTDAPPA
jgi:multidrug resistance efflux pump